MDDNNMRSELEDMQMKCDQTTDEVCIQSIFNYSWLDKSLADVNGYTVSRIKWTQ